MGTVLVARLALALKLSLGGGRLTFMVRCSCRTVTDLLLQPCNLLWVLTSASMAENQKALAVLKQNIKAVIFHFNTLIWDSFVERGDGCKPIGQFTTSKSLHLSSTLQPYTIFSPSGSQHWADSAEQMQEWAELYPELQLLAQSALTLPTQAETRPSLLWERLYWKGWMKCQWRTHQ